MKIIIEMTVEDLSDFRSHMTVIREQGTSMIKEFENLEDRVQEYSGVRSYHKITIDSE